MSTPDAPRILRAGLVSRLLDLASLIATAEEDACRTALDLAAAKEALEGSEAARTMGGLEGKNADERKAFLFLVTQEPRDALRTAQEAHQRASMHLRALTAASSILRAVSRLVASGDDND